MRNGEVFYKLWIESGTVVGERFVVIEERDETCVAIDRKGVKHEIGVNCPDIIRNRQESIDRYYSMTEELKSGNGFEVVELGDTVKFVQDERTVKSVRIDRPTYEYVPTWTGDPSKPRGNRRTPTAPLAQNTVTADAPLAKALIGRSLYEKCVYSGKRGSHQVVIVGIAKAGQDSSEGNRSEK